MMLVNKEDLERMERETRVERLRAAYVKRIVEVGERAKDKRWRKFEKRVRKATKDVPPEQLEAARRYIDGS